VGAASHQSANDIPQSPNAPGPNNVPLPSSHCLFFDALFDSEIYLSTSPFALRTHWNCQLFRTERLFVREGDAFDVVFDIPNVRDVTTWRVSHKLAARQDDPTTQAPVPLLAGA
jgi:hypothetical protein